MSRVIVSGAGPGGSLLALVLARAGWDVTVYDQRADPRAALPAPFRVINLAVPAETLDRLAAQGVSDRVRTLGAGLTGRMLHAPDGSQRFQPYGEHGDSDVASLLTPDGGTRSVQRGDLLALLIDAGTANGVTFRFGCKVVDADAAAGAVSVVDGQAGAPVREFADLIVGADGAASVVRAALRFTHDLRERRTPGRWAYASVAISNSAAGRQGLVTDAFHLWPRDGHLLIALPNADGSFAGTLFLGTDPSAGSSAVSHSTVRTMLEQIAPGLCDLEKETVPQHASSLATLVCSPWFGGRAVLLGDACHTVLPFTGRGASAAIDDALELGGLLTKSGLSLPDALAQYQEKRLPIGDALVAWGVALAPLLLNALPPDGVLGRL